LLPTDTLYVDWAVLNTGTAATGVTFWYDLFIDDFLMQSWYTDVPVNPDVHVTVLDYAIGSLAAGSHSIKIVADSTNIIDEENEGDNEYTKSFTVTTPPAAGITVTSPNGGESWVTGTKHRIQWSYTGDPGTAVKIQLLKAGKAVRTIATSASVGADGKGSFAWNIPDGLTPATNHAIKVSSTTQISCRDSSNKVFSIIKVDAVPLTSGTSVNAFVQGGAWSYYKISAPASLAQFKVRLTNVTGDPDLYVQKSAKPTQDFHDERSTNVGNQPESITLANTGETVWYIGVYGYLGSTYTIKAEAGADETVTLTSGNAVAGSVERGDWKYYRISASSNISQLKVTLTKLTANVNLYLRKSSRPQQYAYVKRSSKSGTLSETITITNTGENVWYIGVYGSSKGNYTVKAVLSMLLGDDQPLEEETADP
jgi:hypothetical protein